MAVIVDQNQKPLTACGPVVNVSRSHWIKAISGALDLAEGLPPGHSRRACWIAMQIADRMALGSADLANMYYAVLLKDIGCTSNAARLFEIYGADDLQLKSDFRRVDAQDVLQLFRYVAGHVTPFAPVRRRLARLIWIVRNGKDLQRELIVDRCERGAELVRRMGLSAAVAQAITSLDEHWNGRGYPNHLAAAQIPILSRIALAAQIVEVFYASGGPAQATRQLCNRSGKTLDPIVVRAFLSVSADRGFWSNLANPNLPELLDAIFPAGHDYLMMKTEVNNSIEVLADVVDAKSPSLDGHSRRVARLAQVMAQHLNVPALSSLEIYHAALLHDIGKLGISNAVLDKPQPWSASDSAAYRRHVALSAEIVATLPTLEALVPIVAMHHERLDGTGFPHRPAASAIPLGSRIIAVADAFDHLCRRHPQTSVSQIAALLTQDAGLDQSVVSALANVA